MYLFLPYLSFLFSLSHIACLCVLYVSFSSLSPHPPHFFFILAHSFITLIPPILLISCILPASFPYLLHILFILSHLQLFFFWTNLFSLFFLSSFILNSSLGFLPSSCLIYSFLTFLFPFFSSIYFPLILIIFS